VSVERNLEGEGSGIVRARDDEGIAFMERRIA
jgi:hypothetical protein